MVPRPGTGRFSFLKRMAGDPCRLSPRQAVNRSMADSHLAKHRFPPMIRDVLMARHGETPSNLFHAYAGWSEESLTERGRRQATSLGHAVSHSQLTRVRTSCIARAKETAQIIASELGIGVVED